MQVFTGLSRGKRSRVKQQEDIGAIASTNLDRWGGARLCSTETTRGLIFINVLGRAYTSTSYQHAVLVSLHQ